MKPFLKKIQAIFLPLLLIACLALAACGAPSKTPPTPENPAETPSTEEPATPSTPEEPVSDKPALGVWWWNSGLGDEYLDFAKNNGVTEIYYCSSKFNESTDAFIEKAEARGMSVYWLAGEYQWVEKPASCFKQVDRYVAYQKEYAHRFSGVHFDIEPHQHPEFKSRREELITKFIELVCLLQEDYEGVKFAYDIPFWLEDEITFRSQKKPAFAHIIDHADRVTLMSYRDTAEAIYGVSESEITYALANDKKLNLGVETKSSEGDKVSFMEEGKQVMYAEIAKLRQMIPGDFGVVIHQIQHWYDLKD